jgi:hypothetical protein
LLITRSKTSKVSAAPVSWCNIPQTVLPLTYLSSATSCPAMSPQISVIHTLPVSSYYGGDASSDPHFPKSLFQKFYHGSIARYSQSSVCKLLDQNISRRAARIDWNAIWFPSDGHFTPTRSYLQGSTISNGRERNTRESDSGIKAQAAQPARLILFIELHRHWSLRIALPQITSKYRLLHWTRFRESFSSPPLRSSPCQEVLDHAALSRTSSPDLRAGKLTSLFAQTLSRKGNRLPSYEP